MKIIFISVNKVLEYSMRVIRNCMRVTVKSLQRRQFVFINCKKQSIFKEMNNDNNLKFAQWD